MAIYKYCLPVLFGSLGLLGCSSLAPDKTDPFADIQQQELSMPNVQLELTESERHARVNALLQEILTPVTAMELTLINSPQVRAELAEIGIAQAQQLQAGLLSNPRFAVGALRPEGGGRWQLDAGISQSILDIFTRPLRTQLAATEFAAAQIELHSQLNRLLYQVQSHYFKTVAANELVQLRNAQYQAAEANLSLAQSLFSAGNIPERELLQYQLAVQAQRRQQREAKTQAQHEAFSLSALLGFDSKTKIRLPGKLPQLPGADDFKLALLLEHARKQRHDLQLARAQVRAAENSLALQNRTGAFTELELGANVERESDGSYKAGPEVAFSLPIFDRGHARLQGIQAAVLHAKALLRAQEIKADVEISNALLSLTAARTNFEEIERISLPLQRKAQALKLREYNFMLSSAFELIEIKQQEFDLLEERIDALRAYWQARGELSLSSGQSLVIDPEPKAVQKEPSIEETPPEDNEPEMDHSMHHHGDHHHD